MNYFFFTTLGSPSAASGRKIKTRDDLERRNTYTLHTAIITPLGTTVQKQHSDVGGGNDETESPGTQRGEMFY